jgi:hypothetical protein
MPPKVDRGVARAMGAAGSRGGLGQGAARPIGSSVISGPVELVDVVVWKHFTA